MTLLRELNAACKQGRANYRQTQQFSTVAISGGWGVRTETVRNTPRGGPMAAWRYLYYLLPPSSHQRLGGYDRADSFCDWAARHIRAKSCCDGVAFHSSNCAEVRP